MKRSVPNCFVLYCNMAALAKVTRIFLACRTRQMSLYHRRSVPDTAAVLSLNDALRWLPLPWQQSATRVTVVARNDRRCITPPTVADQSMKLYYTFSLRCNSVFLFLPSPLSTLLSPHFPFPPSIVPSSHYHITFSTFFLLSSFIPPAPLILRYPDYFIIFSFARSNSQIPGPFYLPTICCNSLFLFLI